MSRRWLVIPLAVAALGVSAPAAGAAPQGPQLTYGDCVSGGVISPSSGVAGPFSLNPNTPTGVTGAPSASVQSGGNSNFAAGLVCNGYPHGNA